MARLDLKKKLTFTSNTLSQKAKNMSEVSGLKSQINAEQNKVENYFLNLGRQYYEHAEEYQIAELRELVGLISESENKIEILKQRISDLENAKVCPNCGIQIEEGAIYCTNCGIKIDGYETRQKEQAPGTAPRFCKSCGSEIPGFAVYCTKCGAKQ